MHLTSVLNAIDTHVEGSCISRLGWVLLDSNSSYHSQEQDHNLDLENFREKITHSAEAQKRSQILQEQLKIALCRLELESLRAVRNSLSEDNSAITHALTLMEEMNNGDETARKTSNDDTETAALTEVLKERLLSFRGMYGDVNRLVAQSKQIVGALRMEDAKRASGDPRGQKK